MDFAGISGADDCYDADAYLTDMDWLAELEAEIARACVTPAMAWLENAARVIDENRAQWALEDERETDD